MDKVLDQVVGDVDGEVLHPPSQVDQLLADEHHVLVLHVEVVRLLTDGVLDQAHLNFLCPIEYHIEGQGVHRCVSDKIRKTHYNVLHFVVFFSIYGTHGLDAWNLPYLCKETSIVSICKLAIFEEIINLKIDFAFL